MMAQLRRDFQWRGNVHICSWAGGQPMDHGVQLALGGARLIRALAAWPWAVRIRNEPLDRPPLGHAHSGVCRISFAGQPRSPSRA